MKEGIVKKIKRSFNVASQRTSGAGSDQRFGKFARQPADNLDMVACSKVSS